MASDAEETPQMVLLRLGGGFRATQYLNTAVALGLPDRLARGPRVASELAPEVGAKPDRLFRLMRTLAALGVLEMDDRGRFGLTPLGQLLRTDVPGSMAAVARFWGTDVYSPFGDLLHAVVTGETAFDHLHGMGHFDFLAQHPDQATRFNQTMAQLRRSAPYPFTGHDLSRYRLIVDVGGGNGTLLARILRENPGLRGILYDLPAATRDAPEVLSRESVSDRCEIRTGSALETVPPGGDAYVLSKVLHDWPDDVALRVLASCRKAMARGATLLLVEWVLPEGVPPVRMAEGDMIMMVMTGGHERTEKEWAALLRAEGFELVEASLDLNRPLVVARAA